MARRFEGAPDEWTLYVPDLWGERELFETDPDNTITMEIHWLTKHEVDAVNRRKDAEVKRTGANRAADRKMLRELFENNVRAITNYDSPIDGQPVVTGSDLFERGEESLGLDVAKAIVDRSHLEAGAAGKLKLRCDTYSEPQTQSKRGGAQDATPRSHLDRKQTETQMTQSLGSMTTRSDDQGVATTKPTQTMSAGTGLPVYDAVPKVS